VTEGRQKGSSNSTGFCDSLYGFLVSQWDRNREDKRREVVEAGLARVLSGSIDALRTLLNASSLSTEVDISRDTIYRIFREGDPPSTRRHTQSAGASRSSDAIVRAVATASHQPEWSDADESFGRVAAVFQDAMARELSLEEAVREVMAVNIDNQFASPGDPVGWIFHAAALTASPAWGGERTLSPRDEALALEILSVRREYFRQLDADLTQMMMAGLAVLGRRPRRGMDPQQLVALVHSLFNGGVLRRLLEPDVFDSHLIAEAAFAVVLAFSEELELHDPRRPGTPDEDKAFDRMLSCASTGWPADSVRSVERTADEAGVPREEGRLLFPTVADLADSLVWARVLGGGLFSDRQLQVTDPEISTGTPPEVVYLSGMLRLVRDVSEELPGAVAVLSASRATVGLGIREELVREAAEILRRNIPSVNPTVTANELVSAAFSGRTGWPTVTSMMRVMTVATT
jgi:hypothetical protein